MKPGSLVPVFLSIPALTLNAAQHGVDDFPLADDARAKIITAAVLALLFAVVVCQNTPPTSVKILFATVSMPRAVLLLLTFVIGLVVGSLDRASRRRK